MNERSRFYVICTTARSGSNLVCDYLFNTGQLGRPAEFLNPDIVRKGAYGVRFSSREPVSVSAYLDWIVANHSTPNGVCGIKMLSEDFEFLGGFPAVRDFVRNATVIRLSRRQKLSQAISYYLAETTGQWMSTDPARVPADNVPFDYKRIKANLERLCRQDARWDARLEGLGVVAERWEFEDFVKDPATFVCGLASRLELGQPELVLRTTLERQSTVRSAYFTERYRQRAVASEQALSGFLKYERMRFRA